MIVGAEALITQYQTIKGEGRAWLQRASALITALDDGQAVSWDSVLQILRDGKGLIDRIDQAVLDNDLNAIAQTQEADPSYDFLTNAAAFSTALKAIRTAVQGEIPRSGTTLTIYTVDPVTIEVSTATFLKADALNTHAAIVAAIGALS